LKKIVVIGPESTGKSTLSEQLALHFKTAWVPEYAREYLVTHGIAYTFEDLLPIAKGQLNLEDEIAKDVAAMKHPIGSKDQLLFIDSDMYVMKVWCEFVFQKCHQFILDKIAERKYDLYLLCNIDLPWSPDPLREHPDKESREQLYRMYEDVLINQSTPWVEISGGYEERLQIAIEAINRIF
jgi:NadR type nicotinamide-nucleotide adenylyltransferase